MLERPGALDPSVRLAAADGGPVPDPLTVYVDRVRRHAYQVTDEDVRELIEAGYSEDQVFELTVATAFGAAQERLLAGLDAMGASSGTAAPELRKGES